jgi:hypothetical protein
MNKYNILLALTIIGCTSGKEDKRNEQTGIKDDCYTFPEKVNSLQITDLYDSARWFIYAWHCDKFYLSKRDTLANLTFGELPLKFSEVTVRQDTLEINFDFIDINERHAILPSMSKNNMQLLTGVGFDLKRRNKIYMLSPSGFSIVTKGGANRYETPLQPEVIMYIKENWDKLNDCFRRLAEQKGIKK